MTENLWFYIKNIFINPAAAAKGISVERKLWPLIFTAFLLGIIPYLLIVLLGYSALGWDKFPYWDYYPYYFDPYWWELLIVPVWGVMIGLAFGIPCYFLGKLFGGKATFLQVIAVVMLASVVSLPVFLLVDFTMYNPNQIIEFAKTGNAVGPYLQGGNWFAWIIQQSYAYIAMGWQAIVTLVGLTVIHKIPWYANLPGLIIGNVAFTLFLLQIRDYVALII
jgi:hypothetical protein